MFLNISYLSNLVLRVCSIQTAIIKSSVVVLKFKCQYKQGIMYFQEFHFFLLDMSSYEYHQSGHGMVGHYNLTLNTAVKFWV